MQLFPNHSRGTAFTITSFLVLIGILSYLTIREHVSYGHSYTANYVLLACFAVIASGLYFFNKAQSNGH